MDTMYLFNCGENYQSYKTLGSFPTERAGVAGWLFRVWAPRAQMVSLVGNFNNWDPAHSPMQHLDKYGIWELFYPGLAEWERYKYAVRGQDGQLVFKADPFARHQEERPHDASVLYVDKAYAWGDTEFRESRCHATAPQPLNIYELHLASWRRYPDGNVYNYRDLALQLSAYCLDMGYNCVELMPLTEYPLDDSWGYQVSGYFAPTARYGTPADFRFMVDHLHQAGLKIILDWVPAHFPKDAFGLYRFDGSPCYEYQDSRLAEHKEWGTMVFDYGKSEVRSFLCSSAWYWLAEYHLDGLRVDAVSSMIYLNYGRTEAPVNALGGNENLEAIAFLQQLNTMVTEHFPHCFVIAEESTAFPYVTRPVSEGGLGFSHKWNMGWMHDTLEYMSVDYYARKYHHNQMTFSLTYAFSERYILPFSHDEVVHGKRSLIGRMPGDIWRQCASLRTCMAWQMGHPGAKLNFMGSEFGQFVEWRFREELEWFMLANKQHRQLQDYSRALNQLYLQRPEFWQDDQSWNGFQWLQADDSSNSVYAFARKALGKTIVIILNLTPAVLENYSLRMPHYGKYRLLLNSDDLAYGGSGFLAACSVGQEYATELKSEAEWQKLSASALAELQALREEALQLRHDFLKQRAQLAALYRRLLGIGNNEQADSNIVGALASLEGVVAEVPEVQSPRANPRLSLALPPLAALILEYVPESV